MFKREEKRNERKALSLKGVSFSDKFLFSILFSFIFIFLISFVSASYNIEILEPFDAPQINATNVTDASSSLDAGTYRVVAVVGKYYQGSFYEGAVRISPPSNIVEVNVSSGEGIFINYSNLDPDAPQIYFHVFNEDSSTYWENAGTAAYGDSMRGFPISSYPDNVTIKFSYTYNDIINVYGEDTPYNLNLSKGIGAINITTIGQDLNMGDIIEDLNNDTRTLVEGEDIIAYGRYHFITSYSLLLQPEDGYNIEFERGSKIASYGGVYFNGEVETTGSFGDVDFEVFRDGGHGISMKLTNGVLDYWDIYQPGTTYTYVEDGITRGENYGLTVSMSTGVTGYGTRIITRQFTGYPNLEDFTIYTNGLIVSPSSRTLTNQKVYGFYQNYGQDFVLRDSTVTNAYAFRYINNNPSSVDYSLDNTFINPTTREEYKYAPASVLNYASSGVDNLTVKEGNTLTLNVFESITNMSLPDASVKIYDNESNLAYEGTTDENGTIETPLYWGETIANDGAAGAHCFSTTPGCVNYTDVNPYVLIIEKENYRSYVGKLEIYEKKNMDITLDEESSSASSIIIYNEGDKIQTKDYPYLNYEISYEKNLKGGKLLEPYIIKTK